MAKRTESELEVNGKTIKVSNLAKVFYPATGFTKGDMIKYYIDVAPAMIPHLENRPVSLKRYPDGTNGMFFYEKQCPKYRPEWIKTAPVWSDTRNSTMNYCLLNDMESLVWAANLAVIEFHPSLSRKKTLQKPDFLAFDLDPGDGTSIVDCCKVALQIRKMLAAAKLDSFPKTSGSKGLQLYAPLNTQVSYAQTKSFSKAIAIELEQTMPKKVVSKMAKVLRRGKVFIDWSQNDEHKTTIAVYSMRAKERPTISTPLKWEEVEAASKARRDVLRFEPNDVLKRLDRFGDLFLPVLKMKQRLRWNGTESLAP